ncbi:MAG TPA: hypothetical protein VF503_31525 [Sphingobium sp.]|uniref:hypothetical protein n=1 Tax=Sphingobium sp. TaxID=1912891 RepID=UPI002ECFC8A8
MLIIACIAFSGIVIAMLCRGDPKRRRSARAAGAGQAVTTRRLLAVTACLPGILLALMGDAAAFLIWMGGGGVLGWFTTLWFGRRGKA